MLGVAKTHEPKRYTRINAPKYADLPKQSKCKGDNMTRTTTQAAPGGLPGVNNLRFTTVDSRAERMEARIAELDANYLIEVERVEAAIRSIRDGFLGTKRNATR